MSALGQKQTYAAQQVMSALPQLRLQKRIFALGHVRFTPESGNARCTKRYSGHRVYSITSSAVASSDGGTYYGERPSWIAAAACGGLVLNDYFLFTAFLTLESAHLAL